MKKTITLTLIALLASPTLALAEELEGEVLKRLPQTTLGQGQALKRLPQSTLRFGPAPKPTLPTPDPEPEPTLTYKEAYEKAKKTGLPLVVWVGGNFCPECVKETSKDYVHYFTEFYTNATAPAIVVGVPEKSMDDIVRAQTIPSRVITPQERAGGLKMHIESIKEVIKAYKEGTLQHSTGVRGWSTSSSSSTQSMTYGGSSFQFSYGSSYGGYSKGGGSYGGGGRGFFGGRGRSGGC